MVLRENCLQLLEFHILNTNAKYYLPFSSEDPLLVEFELTWVAISW